MAGTSVIYYPPTTGYPYLVVTFLPDRSLQATPFDSEEEASAFIDRVAPSPQLPIRGTTSCWPLREQGFTLGVASRHTSACPDKEFYGLA